MCFPRRGGAEDAARGEFRARASAEAGDLATLGPGSGEDRGSAGRSLGIPGTGSPGGMGVAPWRGEGGPRGRYLALRAAGGAEGRRALTPGPGPTPDPAPTARSLQPPPPPLSTNPRRVTSGAAP